MTLCTGSTTVVYYRYCEECTVDGFAPSTNNDRAALYSEASDHACASVLRHANTRRTAPKHASASHYRYAATALCEMKGGDGRVSGISLLKSTHPKRNDRAVAEATAVVRHRRSSMAFQALLFLVQALGNYLSPS